MKVFIKSHLNTYTFLIALILLISVNSSCSKKENEISNLDQAFLKFNVEGISNAITSPSLKASVGNMVGLSVSDENTTTISNHDFSLEIISNQVGISNIASNTPIDRKTKLADASPIATDIRYRILVYTMEDELVASVEAEAGKEQSIAVTPGESYKWRAYSYNSSTAMPTFNPSNPVIETPTATSLLFDKSDNTGPINGINNPLPIIFKHQLTQLNVQIGMSTYDNFRTVTEVTGEFLGDVIKKRTFNVFTGNMEGILEAVNVGPVSFSQLEAGSNKTMIAKSYYTADTSYTSYSFKVNTLKIKNTTTTEKDLTPNLPTPNGGVPGQINFVGFSGANKGSILLGEMQISIIIPQVKILAYSNGTHNGGYRLGPGTRSRAFLTDVRNFGPQSKYVKTNGITVTSLNWGTTTDKIATQLSNPANYPDILYLACNGDYLDANDWAAVKLYLQKGGTVYHGQDNTGSLASSFIADIFGGTTGSLARPGENNTTYKFTDTPEGAQDSVVLKGPFGDVTNLYWGQDRVGTVYFTGYSSVFENNAIIYSTHAQNAGPISPATTPRACYFRHKTLNYFFIGDGGFTLWDTNPNWGRFPFRTNADNFPIVEGYGAAAPSNSPGYSTVAYRTAGNFPIANSLMFGNLINQFINKVHYNGIDRTP